MKIRKYKIQEDPVTPTLSAVKMPQGARCLTAGLDSNSQLCVWAEVNPAAVMQDNTFQSVLTGEDVPTQYQSYLGMVKAGQIILHIYKAG